jgi:hypothetical protein
MIIQLTCDGHIVSYFQSQFEVMLFDNVKLIQFNVTSASLNYMDFLSNSWYNEFLRYKVHK